MKFNWQHQKSNIFFNNLNSANKDIFNIEKIKTPSPLKNLYLKAI